MPERVTRKERQLSLVIAKAREAKELLYQSLMDNNRSPEEDDSEAVKLKRPKAENVNIEIKNNEGTHSGYGLAGQLTKAMRILKAVNAADYRTNPFLDEEERQNITQAIESTERSLRQLREELKTTTGADREALKKIIAELNNSLTPLEEMLNQIPETKTEQTPTLDEGYQEYYNSDEEE